jgi:CheY-like chemotaxis protein
MDMQMPVLDGLEATRRIKAGGGPNADAPVIALTANALEHHRAAWAEVGVDLFVSKPIDPRQLVACLALAAERAPRRRAA